MKKYSITTTVNGKALVKQEHTFGTDDCTTSYGDIWSFESCAEAGAWVDKELGIFSNAKQFIDRQIAKANKSLLEKIAEDEKVIND